MKLKHFSIVLLCVAFLSCVNDDQETQDSKFESTGIFLGLNKGLCICCGNWEVKIDGSQDTLQFIELPEESKIDLINTTFPIPVMLNWSKSTYCGFIIIDDIELITIGTSEAI